MRDVNQHIGDINSKTIFKNNILCAQFIRDNINIPLLKNVQPEDLEDKIDVMADDAMKSGNIMVNPRRSTKKDIVALYKKAM